MISAITTDSASSDRLLPPQEELPIPSSRPASALEDRLMQKLLSKAYSNKDKAVDQMSYSVSSVGTGTSFGTSVGSRTNSSYPDTSRITTRSDDNSSLASTEYDSLNPNDKKFIRMYFQDLEEERSALMAQWREDFNRENSGGRQNTTIGDAMKLLVDKLAACLLDPFWRFLSYAEVFIANMPMTIAGVGLSWVTQGVIWFKFMGE
jgi:hypothetical protein